MDNVTRVAKYKTLWEAEQDINEKFKDFRKFPEYDNVGMNQYLVTIEFW